jgi:hypothetical protein
MKKCRPLHCQWNEMGEVSEWGGGGFRSCVELKIGGHRGEEATSDTVQHLDSCNGTQNQMIWLHNKYYKNRVCHKCTSDLETGRFFRDLI